MSSRSSLLAACLASTSVLALASPAMAQIVAPDSNPVYIDADQLHDIENGSAYRATGNVRVRQGDRVMMADELEYRPAENRVLARGNVVMIGADGAPQFADEVELDTELAAGIALGFAAELENNGRMASAVAIRDNTGSVQLEEAYYTACPLCESGEEEPTWRLRAREVVQDAEDRMIYYRGARFEVLGVPVFYSPVFAHPDPSVARRSGFLPPRVGLSSRLGAVYEQPYFWAISPSQDLVIAPRLMGNVNPLIYGEYSKRFWSGQMDFEGSYTREYEIDSDGERFGDREDRYHIFGGGEWRINETWNWGFGIQRAHDDLYLRRYDFSERPDRRDHPLPPANRRLTSQLFTEHRGQSSQGTIVAASFQSLRSREDDDAIPDIAPMIDFTRVFTGAEGWGRLNLNANGVYLDRTLGNDYGRASVTADWRTRWVASSGLIVEPFAYARGDYYSLNDVDDGTGTLYDDEFSRPLVSAGAEMSWPLIRPGSSVDWIVEPVASYVYASDDDYADRVINEDSGAFDLNDSVLFEVNRAPGYDIWENGQRVSAGLRGTALWGSDSSVRLFLGRSYRLDGEPVFGEASGLFEDQSDYVVAGTLDIGPFVAELSSRHDTEDFDVNRIDTRFGYNGERNQFSIRYVDVSNQAAAKKVQELRLTALVGITEDWSFLAATREDLDSNTLRRMEAGLRYQDDCTRLDIIYERKDQNIQDFGASESIRIQVTFATLGGFDGE